MHNTYYSKFLRQARRNVQRISTRHEQNDCSEHLTHPLKTALAIALLLATVFSLDPANAHSKNPSLTACVTEVIPKSVNSR